MKYLLPLSFVPVLATVLSAATPPVLGQFDRTLSVSGPVDLDALTESGGIVITTGAAGTVRVHGTLTASDYFGLRSRTRAREASIHEIERNPPIEQNGDTLRIGHLRDPLLLEGISLRLEIEVPRETRIRAHANSGGIHVTGVHGPVECQTHSGGVRIRDIDGDVTAAANSGSIQLSHVNGAATAHANSGGIEAYEIAGAINAQTNSGGVRVSQTLSAPIHARASSGGVAVTLAHGAGYNVTVDTGSGRITTPEMTIRSGFSRHHVEGTVRGGGPEVNLRASSGSVRIE